MQPGGHLDNEEYPLDAAKRETLEETGIAADFSPEIFHIDVHDTPSGHTHYDIRYLAWTDDVNFRPPSGESQKVAWFALGALTSLPDRSTRGAFSKIIKNHFA
jgi:8-oxo-dGTP pyrophosphatase MutT (NUDIX family)